VIAGDALNHIARRGERGHGHRAKAGGARCIIGAANAFGVQVFDSKQHCRYYLWLFRVMRAFFERIPIAVRRQYGGKEKTKARRA
jgi:hypothetical protein